MGGGSLGWLLFLDVFPSKMLDAIAVRFFTLNLRHWSTAGVPAGAVGG